MNKKDYAERGEYNMKVRMYHYAGDDFRKAGLEEKAKKAYKKAALEYIAEKEYWCAADCYKQAKMRKEELEMVTLYAEQRIEEAEKAAKLNKITIYKAERYRGNEKGLIHFYKYAGDKVIKSGIPELGEKLHLLARQIAENLGYNLDELYPKES